MALSIVSSIFLTFIVFVPPEGAPKIKALLILGQKHIGWIAVIWAFSIVYTLGYCIDFKIKNYQKQKEERLKKEKEKSEKAEKEYQEKLKTKKREQRLHNLTPPEKKILSYYLANNTRTQKLSMWDGIVIGLINADILYQAGKFTKNMIKGMFDININDWAFEYLQKHPELLE